MELLVAIIGFVIIICFFVLGSNVGSIKSMLRQRYIYQPNHLAEYYKQIAIGNKERALDAIREYTWIEFQKIRRAPQKNANFTQYYEGLKAANEARYRAVGAEFPPEPDWQTV